MTAGRSDLLTLNTLISAVQLRRDVAILPYHATLPHGTTHREVDELDANVSAPWRSNLET